MASPGFARPPFIPSVTYRDPRAALKWLQAVFGFEPSEVLTDAKDNIIHAEMTHDGGVVMIGSEWQDWTRSPLSLDGKNTQRVHVRIQKGIDEHYAHVKQAGAKIVVQIAEQFYGDRTYVALDLEGHYWSFAQTTRNLTKEDMEKATGLTFKKLT